MGQRHHRGRPGRRPRRFLSRHAAWEAFWNFELPQDIVTERGYPQLTDQAKRKILGGNLARLHGIDVEAKQKELNG